ncbi:predicted protein [Sclerotinia sclerotiorum 1980 UF-70]|uniref:Uncharacterized protein n=2 Tax=Sclerotinia sclerotiorum (strain ATCC 18683 / 1980 / Ss-1) TaxID=665079 RepID=A7EG31_SCLS1|nr:predicted protein [Sclerotinia sclerotiorum 1980 UF-70]APA07037.1 hypothetical protein sscle_02g018070 [Sclerotinia sclerotiorum 1980 UF-70]EDO01797.1 predicted protein [Sclerotinia sclerotiorum 1980 UF-70]
MTGISFYIFSFQALFILCLLVIIVLLIQNYVDEKRLIATPSIRKDEAILTAYASIKINASADQVFDAITSFERYGSGFSQYKWDNGQDKMPVVGARGLYSFRVEDIQDRCVPVVLTLLDPVHKKMAAKTTQYPDWLLGTERVQEVVPIKGKKNICEYRNWITLQGFAAYYPLLTAKEELEDVARDAATELKTFVETRKHEG